MRRELRWLQGKCACLSGSTSPGSSPDMDIMLCTWEKKNFTLTVPLSTQVFKRASAKVMVVVTLQWTRIASKGEDKYS